MPRTLLLATAFTTALLLAAPAWAPPPAGGGGARPAPPPPPRPPVGRPPTGKPPVARPGGGSPGVHPPIGPARPEFGKAFDAARAKSAAEAAALLRAQTAYLGRADRAVMLNAVTYQMLRQKEAASLAELRRLRADWDSLGVGIDPVLGMELEAIESAAERVLLAESLRLATAGEYAASGAKIDALGSPRYLPADVVRALPDLRAALHRAAPARAMQAALAGPNPAPPDVLKPVAHINPEAIPADIRGAADAWGVLLDAADLFAATASGRGGFAVGDWERVLSEVKRAAGDAVAGKLRAEAAAALFLANRPADAAKLLTDDADPSHARAILADLQVVALGRGEITTPQIAAFVPADAKAPPACVAAVLPPDQLKHWKSPARRAGETTAALAIDDAKRRLKKAIDTEVDAATTVVSAAADRVRRSLAADAGPLKEFLEKVATLRGKPLTPAESDIAAVAGRRGLTVAETAGVLATDADRPASAARLVAVVPVFASPAELAVRAELASRAPAAFAAHPAAGHKLTAAPDRARIRAAVRALLDAHAAKLAAALPVEPLDRPALETGVARRLGVAPGALPPGECVQALLDVCTDWADDHARLLAASEELSELLTALQTYTADEEELKQMVSAAQLRRLTVHQERKRREAGVTVGCRLLGEYGADAASARAWLGMQLRPGRPWGEAANAAMKRIQEK